jgi:hypothetical protein
MAVESCAGAVLDREYERLLQYAGPLPGHRFATLQVNKHEQIKKDPVFISLRNGSGEGGSRFLGLLHECPLYLLKKSLQLELPTIYAEAHALYRTRNSLAHTGTTEAGKKSGLLAITGDGALDGLRTANAVLNWFGEAGTHVPDHQFIQQ